MSIGGSWGRSRPIALLAAVISAVLVVADFWLVVRGDGLYLGVRAVLPLAAVTAYLGMARGDYTLIGLRLRPAQGLRYWLVATLVIAIAVGAFITIGGLALVLTGRALSLSAIPPRYLLSEFVHMCLVAPLVEEATYRLGLCTGAVPLLGARCTIAVSGLTFGALHVLYGNPGPDNLVAGFFLAWAYLKSESFLVPLVLHSLGNLCVLSAQVANWYWLSRA